MSSSAVPARPDLTTGPQAAHLAELFRTRCLQQAGREAFAWVRDDLSVAESLSFETLERQSTALALRLAARSAPASRVLLALRPGLDFVRCFWACVLAGLVPVPVPALDAARVRRSAPRLAAIAADAQAELGVCDADALEILQGDEWRSSPTMQWLDVAALAAGPAGALPADASGGDIAYLQYTSGSTLTPRGVCVTHANVIANLAMWREAVGAQPHSRFLNWLPHFHDYGLVFGILLPFSVGAGAWLMSPLSFLRRPLRWLDAMGAFAITHSAAPDSAYATCVRLAAQNGWQGDLQTVEVLSCGAEPIRAATADGVGRVLGRSGLRPGAFAPAYGLAESVLGVSSSPAGAGVRRLAVDRAQQAAGRVLRSGAADAPQLVGCGPAMAGVDVRIVDPETRDHCAPGVMGEIWVQSAAVGAGYWRRPAESAETFGAFTADGAGPYLRTGDLGFLDEGALFVAGRLKDLIVIHGENVYPHDVEWVAERAHPGLRTGGYACAFGFDRAVGEAVVVLVEASGRVDADEATRMLRAVRREVVDAHELPIHAVALLRGGSLPRTSSGKIQRGLCRRQWEAGELRPIAVLAQSVPAAAGLGDEGTEGAAHESAEAAAGTGSVLRAIWREVLGHDDFRDDDAFVELGGSSLMLTQVASRVQARLGVELPWEVLLDRLSFSRLAQIVGQAPPCRPDAGSACAGTVPREGPWPASLSQRRMWLVQKFEPDSVAYNVPLALHLRGPIDPAAWVRAVEVLTARHESLRARLALENGVVVQVIDERLQPPCEHVDLGHLPESGRTEAARRLATAYLARPFDLEQGPLQRVLLIRLDAEEHVFLWAQHHAITDNWSMAILLKELLACQAAWAQGQEARLAPLPMQYADFAAQQHEPLEVARRQAQLDHWLRRLRALKSLELPTDFARQPGSAIRGHTVSVPLPDELLGALRQRAASQRATPFVLLLTAFQVLLSRYAATEDVAVVVPVANRHHIAAEQLVGTLVNSVVMRTQVPCGVAVGDLLAQVRRTAIEVFDHQDLPFDELVEALDYDRAHQLNGPLRVLFNVVNAPLGQPPELPFTFKDFDIPRTAAQFELSLHVDTEFGRRICVEYASALFAEATMQRLLANYLALVRQLLCADESLPVSALEAVCAEELALVERWQGPAAEVAGPPLVPSQLQAGLRARPDAVALVDAAGARLRFGELDARSDALARRLRDRGIARGHRVGLSGARDVNMVVGMLAVLKAGAAYVPLDPAFPVERLAHMVADAQPSALVVAGDAGDCAAWAPGVPVFDAAACPACADGPLAPDPGRDARPDDAAYLIYTSGSTGRPKGVAVPHRAVVNFLASMAHTPGLDAGDRLLAVTTLSFDIAVLELLLPLDVGAQAVIASHAQVHDPRQLATLIAQHGITVMQATPSAWNALLDTGWAGGPDFRALVGGEALPAPLADRLLARCGALWNLYGPTESTVWSSCWRVRAPHDGIAIGRPIDNTQIWVLDPQGRRCPVGVPGEAHIGGAGLALGYHERPALTDERFVPDPFGGRPGARLYRTGDRCRWRHDGQLEHLGRLDHQVKVRGFRIELGEIDAVLHAHPAVAQCVTVTRAEREGDVRLVAYCVLREPGTDAAALRAHLRTRLPEYMLPQHFVPLPRLPLLPNGKIDRQSLPAPASEVAVRRGSAAAASARTPQESAMAEIWAELLGVDEVCPSDNFFDLGGHSLLAMRAVSAIERRLGWHVAPRRFVFETLRQIAHPA